MIDNSRPVLATGMAAGKTTHRKMTPREMHEQTKRLAIITSDHHNATELLGSGRCCRKLNRGRKR